MAYVTVPKDLTKIKSKMLFGLTKRQLVCFGSAALVGVPLFFLSKGSMGTTPAALCMILVMLPFFLFALYEKNGQTPEALLGNLIQCKFTRPKKRVYQTNNAYSALEKQAELERTVGRIASGAGKRGKGRRRLTRQERKQIEAVIRQAKGDGKNHTVQASLPFRNMHPDGLCRLDDRHFSKTIAYADVSYRLAGPDDQRDIFERLCDFYNGYDPSIGVQMTLSSSHKADGGDLFRMAAQGDELDGIRAEASGILPLWQSPSAAPAFLPVADAGELQAAMPRCRERAVPEAHPARIEPHAERPAGLRAQTGIAFRSPPGLFHVIAALALARCFGAHLAVEHPRPCADVLQDGNRRKPFFGKGILHARRHLVVTMALNHPRSHKLLDFRGEDGVGNVGELVAQLAVAQRVLCGKHADDT